MGQVTVDALARDAGIELVGAMGHKVSGDSLTLPAGGKTIPLSANLEEIITSSKPQVMVDFTVASAVIPAVETAAKQGVNLVIGTTGLKNDEITRIAQITEEHNVGAVLAPNFALGAVLMIHMAKIAARYLESAEIIELHHDRKLDAPSGTARQTARAMVESRGSEFKQPPQKTPAAPSRGEVAQGISIHSVRLPGLMAHQEVIFGGTGQTLSIRHDSISRECFMPGVIMATKEVVKHKGLIHGLDQLLGLK
jgi:4-hydroxy-tetrahydrodipicolinate reductase